MKKKNTIVKFRHRFWFEFYRPIARLIGLFAHFKTKKIFKIKKGEQYIILSNHQTELDGVLIMLSFNRNIYALVTDSFFSNGFISKLMSYQLGLISKKKGVVDIKANMDMMKVMKEGGSLLFFPEGNRSYGEFQFPFTDGFVKFIRHFEKPIVLHNFVGGFGVRPRFGKKPRKGTFYGEIKKVIYPDEYKNMSDEELSSVISENLKVYDSKSGEKYISKSRAECLERVFFICPKCGKMETLKSDGNYIYCTSCGLKVEYTEDLHLKSDDESFKFKIINDWYKFQIQKIREFVTNDEVIFKDENVKLFISHVGQKRQLIEEGTLMLYKNKMMFNNREILLKNLEIASPISGTKFNFSTNDEDYLVVGNDRFNPLKYVLMFNKLDTKMKEEKLDIYYDLQERN